MEENKKTRQGLHKYFHVSQIDSLICVLGGIIFIVIAILNAFSNQKLSFITWMDALQSGFLFVIAGLVMRMYYQMFEASYDE